VGTSVCNVEVCVDRLQERDEVRGRFGSA